MSAATDFTIVSLSNSIASVRLNDGSLIELPIYADLCSLQAMLPCDVASTLHSVFSFMGR